MNKINTLYGYARVSSKDQKLDRQLKALQQYGVNETNIFKEKISGSNFKRPTYKKLLRKLSKNDTLVITSIDRLGRNYKEIIEQWRILTKQKEIYIVVLDMPLLNTKENANGLTGEFLSDIFLQILSYVAQIERENIKQRQAEGIAAAKQRGVKFGRPKLKKPANFDKVMYIYLHEQITRKEASEMLGVSACTFDRWKSESLTKI